MENMSDSFNASVNAWWYNPIKMGFVESKLLAKEVTISYYNKDLITF